MSFCRSFWLNQPFTLLIPVLSCTLRLCWTTGRPFSSSIQRLHDVRASAGWSTVSNTVAITRYCIAKMRSNVDSASFEKASVAFSRAILNLSFALASFLVVDSVSSKFRIPSVSDTASAHAACAASAPVSLLGLISLSTSYNNSIPSSKWLILADKSFFDSPSSLSFIS